MDAVSMAALGSSPVSSTAPLIGAVDMTNEEYHAAPGISKSHLDAIADRSPLHYWAEYIDPERTPVRTAALDFGNAFHCAVLEPETFEHRFAVEPSGIDGRSKEGKLLRAQFAAASAGKTILTDSEWDACVGMRDAVHRHRVAAGLVTGGVAEETHFAIDAETGELIKCRIDYRLGELAGGMIVDLKSAEDAGPSVFGRAAARFRYDIAPAWYYRVLQMGYGVRPAQWVWLAIEKQHPYAIGVYYATDEQIERAWRTARRDYHRILECRRRNAWPDYGADIQPLELPPYVRR